MTRQERDELAALSKRVGDLELIARDIRTSLRVFLWIAKLGIAFGGFVAFFKGASSWDSVVDGFRELVR